MASLPSYILYFLLLVGPLVLIHELGHFVVAKLCGVKVVRFSFGFGPRLLGLRIGETDYRLSLLPLGGYVKMAGDNPGEALAESEKGRGFLEASPWRRALIALAGPSMNLLLPILVYFAIAVFAVHEGVAPVVGAIMPGSPAEKGGMLPGDKIVAVQGNPIHVFDDLRDLIGERAGQPLDVRVVRAGQPQPVDLRMVPQSFEESDDLETTHRGVIGIRPMLPPAVVGVLSPNSAAALAGLKTFDRIVKVGDRPTPDLVALNDALRAAPAGPLSLTAIRGQALGYPGLGPGLPEVVRVNLNIPAAGTSSAGLGAALGLESDDLYVRWVLPKSPAARAGIRVGDRLMALDGQPLGSWWGLEESLRKAAQREVTLQLQRPGLPPHTVDLKAEMLDLGESPVTGEEVKVLTLGLLHDGEPLLPTDRAIPRDWIFPPLAMVPIQLPVGEALGKSIAATVDVSRKEILGIFRIFQGRISVKKLGGPLMIADVARQAAADGLAAFLFMMTLVSVNLGLVNLLPMPVLDGGHIATAVLEGIRRKPLSRRAAELTNAFGLALLVALMAFVLINDIVQQRGPSLLP